MSAAAHELLLRLAELGATVRPAGDQLFLRAGAKPIPGEFVKRLRESKADLVRALGAEEWATRVDDERAWWRRHYIVRAIDRGLSGYRPEGQARRLAFQDLMDRWHKLHGRRWPAWQCAGCDEPIGGRSALTLADGNRIHFDKERECLIRFGESWRREATAGLKALGLDPSKEFTT